jgi:hypothetical protein
MAFAKSSNYLLIGMFLIDIGTITDHIECLSRSFIR